jgi:hypothetical protein
MKLPQISNNNLSTFFDKEEIVRETAEQIMKDFGMFGVEITFSGDTLNAYEELLEQLVRQVTNLSLNFHDKLLSVLYQVDITEREIAQAQLDLPHYSHIEIISHQVIARELKKVLWRYYFKTRK